MKLDRIKLVPLAFFFILFQCTVFAIHLQRLQLYPQHNAKKCHTSNFRFHPSSSNDLQPLIIRRGSIISLSAYFTTSFNSRQHRLSLRMQYAGLSIAGSSVDVQVAANSRFTQSIASNADEWQADLYRVAGNEAHLELYVPLALAVGKWNLFVYLHDQKRLVNSFQVPNEVYILFNPWNSLDSVYLNNEADRQEYVLNEVGRIYMGSDRSKESRDWYFEQFGENMLKISHFIMLKSGLNENQRSNPFYVSRAISALVNSNDENGVVMGRWDLPYKPYTSPWSWVGSAQILNQYYNSRGSPVRYGQCWVFGAVATTLARTIGIPARPITTYGAAHDTDDSMTIDRYFDQGGTEIKSLTSDSIWNFHVWTECWFRRNDLHSVQDLMNPLAGHWQVIDATPQEQSHNGRYELGPTQVALVRSGETGYPHDMSFVYSEVNADVVFYRADGNGKYYRSGVNTASVGTSIITRGPNGAVLDLTSHYKYREGTKEERQSFRRASKSRTLSYAALVTKDGEEEEETAATPENEGDEADKQKSVIDPMLRRMMDSQLMFELASESKQPIGETMLIRYRLVNTRHSTRSVFVNLAVNSIFYNGQTASKVMNVAEEVSLSPMENLTIEYRLTADEYLGKRVEFGNFHVVGFARLTENNETFVVDQNIELEQPSLQISFSDGPDLVEDQESRVLVGLNNPLNVTLTECKLILKDEFLFELREESLPDIAPLQKLRLELAAHPSGKGNSTLIAVINCEQLYDVRGSVVFQSL